MNMELGQVWTIIPEPTGGHGRWSGWRKSYLASLANGTADAKTWVWEEFGDIKQDFWSASRWFWHMTQEGDAVFHSQYIKWSQNTEQALYPPEVIWGCVAVVQLSSRPMGSALGCLACCCGPFAPSTTAARAWTILLAISRTQWVLNRASSALGHQFCS